MMESIMIDDTREPSQPNHDASFFRDLEEISQYRITRNSCYEWAQNLCYLSYDDTDDGVDELTSNIYDLWNGKEEIRSRSGNARESDIGMSSGKSNSFPSNRDDSCDLCQKLPKFPSHKRARNFRVVQFGKPGQDQHNQSCTHYIAVSYCWPKDANGVPQSHESTYKVCEKGSDGTERTRNLRAPEDVIDRAVEYARQLNIRLIWIDQECLPQDASAEHAMGVQAMDMVYQQAYASIGLIDHVVATQAQFDAISTAMSVVTDREDSDRKGYSFRSRDPNLEETALDLVSFLEAFGNDPFNSRAWILQEMFSAGQNAVLLIRHEVGAKYEELRPRLVMSQLGIPGVFRIALNDMQKLILESKPFLNMLLQHLQDEDLLHRAYTALKRLELFYPRYERGNHWTSFVSVQGGTAFGARRTCNAAVALTYLSTRHNFFAVDRLAILANICDYEVRLDVQKIETKFRSLATCLLILAFINGDISLFIPEVYNNVITTVTGSIGSWMPKFHQILPSIKSDILKPDTTLSLRNTNRYHVEGSSIILPGYLWTVDRCINLEAIRETFRPIWEQILTPKTYQFCAPAENDEQLKARVAQLQKLASETQGQAFNVPDFSKMINKAGQITDYTLIAERLEENVKARNILGAILYNILAFLHFKLGETAVANSIWHCIRVDAVKLARPPSDQDPADATELPDDVEALFEFCRDVTEPWDIFKLDRTNLGTYFQTWIVKRIMKDGCLWIGRYNRGVDLGQSKDREPEEDRTEGKSQSEQFKADSPMEAPSIDISDDNASANNNDDSVANADTTTTTTEDAPDSNSSDLQFKSKIIHRQLTKQLLASAIGAQSRDHLKASVNIGAMVGFAYTTFHKDWDKEAEDRRCARMAVFDVDGPCEVFTPFDSDLERLPRPEHRSMSLCWMVDRVQEEPDEERKQQDTENVVKDAAEDSSTDARRLEGAIVSKTPEQESIEPEVLIPEAKVEAEAEADSKDDGKFKGASSSVCAVLRVTGRLRGAWECMDDPMQSYKFV